MTYKELAKEISKLSPEQQECNVTVFVASVNEYQPVTGELMVAVDTDILDAGHPVLQIE